MCAVLILVGMLVVWGFAEVLLREWKRAYKYDRSGHCYFDRRHFFR